MIYVVDNPSSSSPWLIGKSRDGYWVVRDRSGLHGGMFTDRAEALRFALFENGRRPQAVAMVPDPLELDFNQRAKRAA